MRHATESIYKGIVLPKMLYCSTKFLRISDTMGNKFKYLQVRAIKIIDGCPLCHQEPGFMTLLNQKNFKAALLIFKCLHGTAFTKFASYCE